ncbi:MAG: hypothetical protein EA418_14385 [Wenzhouxiangellaceae bacterium]|nr:MAG: hypothetical protein EA418_14385 [Wenzhouxiangellaceae bacterium]
MSEVVLIVAASALIAAGCLFFLAGTVGLLRLPDFYCRLHATTKCDAVGAVLILSGVALVAGIEAQTIRILALIALIAISSPTAGHALARAGWHAGHRPWTREAEHEPE